LAFRKNSKSRKERIRNENVLRKTGIDTLFIKRNSAIFVALLVNAIIASCNFYILNQTD
jgi:hypothetical protein